MQPASPLLSRLAIEDGLRLLGIQHGDALEVHSSLSSFGPVAGGAHTVIAALMDVVGESGTLVMSAYPVSPAIPLTEDEVARGITWKVRRLEPGSREKTGMGRIADEFSLRPDVICGQGLHRVCAWGNRARWHSEGYQNLLEADGWVLLLGVGIDRCSSMHQAERGGLPREIARIFDLPEDIRQDYPPELWDIGYGGTPIDPWNSIWQEAGRRGLIKRGVIGRAECCLFKANAVVRLYAEQLRADPYRLFGVEPDE